MSNYYEKMKLEMELRGYSPNTQKHYSSQVRLLEKYLDKPSDQILPDEIKEYLHHRVKSGIGYSSINIACNAFKVMFNLVLQRNFSDDVIVRPKKPKKLPYTLSREEILSILEHISSPKHRTILLTIYSSGLRISEVLNLKVLDIDSKNMLIKVRCGIRIRKFCIPSI
ncbi:MAG: tyrosine-type recombinase/integrase [Alkaliphilus sp.]